MTQSATRGNVIACDGVPALRILIVEDHADCAESTAMFLRLFGHVVEIAGKD